MNVCYLGLGSNQKYPERQLRQAINRLKKLPHTSLTLCSGFYWNKAWGLQRQPDFCNVVVEIKTYLTPQDLLKHCQRIEKTHGRVRRQKWGPRTLDIDIILYGTRFIKSKSLVIPHPYFMMRDFVLKPLLEINPGLIKIPTQFTRNINTISTHEEIVV